MTTDLSKPFSIVIPTRNEEETLGAVLAETQDMTDDLIVVDGHSTDKTVEIAKAYGARVLEDHGRGKGDALRVGLEHVRHSIVVFMDADGSHGPKDIPKLVAPVSAGEADLVIGSRMLGGSEEMYGTLAELVRMIGGITITLVINFRYGARFTDYQNGFRAIRTDVARAVELKSDLSPIEQEMAMKCLRYGYRIAEQPAHEYRRKGGVSKIEVMPLAPKYLWNLISEIIKPCSGRAPSVVGSSRGVDEKHSSNDGGETLGSELR